MNAQTRPLFALVTLVSLAATSPAALAGSDNVAFDRAAKASASAQPQQGKWINALLPEAAGDFVAPRAGTSADAQFMRAIAYYTREQLDRGGWVNRYAPEGNYASGNALLAVRAGDGITVRSPA